MIEISEMAAVLTKHGYRVSVGDRDINLLDDDGNSWASLRPSVTGVVWTVCASPPDFIDSISVSVCVENDFNIIHGIEMANALSAHAGEINETLIRDACDACEDQSFFPGLGSGHDR